jgi:hypothetical protein
VDLSESSTFILFTAIQSSKLYEFSWKFLHETFHDFNSNFILLDSGNINKEQLFVQTTQWLFFVCNYVINFKRGNW